ncbi:hypothetical protein BASA81_002344 [Batrachochytrium salamandrivorans]|nr:hypothetical protein BASA81_002344 [Batrachochytrium salamandrivorans]
MPSNHFVAGALSACLTTTLLHPLDTVKIRFQVHEQKTGYFSSETAYRSTWQSIVHASRTEGIRSLYMGLTPALVANGVSWGSYFFFYEKAKVLLEPQGSTTIGHLASGVIAGSFTVVITNPMWLVKTRMQLQTLGPSKASLSALAVSQSIFQHDGVMGFYRGVVPALILTSHGAVQFAIYEELKRLSTLAGRGKDTPEYLLMGGLSKICATIVTYPIQLVKTRMQQEFAHQHSAYRKTVATLRFIAQNEGMLGFYKGLGPNLLKVAPQSAILFALYENILNLL